MGYVKGRQEDPFRVAALNIYRDIDGGKIK
jgi:hypothetical protein